MGCCTSANAVNPNSPRSLYPESIDLQLPPPSREALDFGRPSTSFLYILGSTKKNPTLALRFDPQTQQLSALQLPEIVTQKTKSFYNYTGFVCIGQETFLICGGIDQSKGEIQISDRCFIYEPLKKRIRELQSMRQGRYSPIIAFYEDYVYIFGGRYYGENDSEAILRSSERFSLSQRINIFSINIQIFDSSEKWSTLPDLRVQRCTGFSLVYNKTIYIFGGYTSQFNRTTVIQILDPTTLQLSVFAYELDKGLQCGTISPVPNSPGKFLLFGGNMKYGATSAVKEYDFANGTVLVKKPMKEPRSLQKGFVSKDQVKIFGGCDNYQLQIYNLSTHKWDSFQSVPTINLSMHGTTQQWDSLTGSLVTCDISSHSSSTDQLQTESHNKDYKDQLLYVFGTDEEPLILQINISVPLLTVLPVPLKMKCYAYQSGTLLQANSGRFFLAGGATNQLDEVSSDCFLYNAKTQKAQKLPNMKTARYAFPSVYNAGLVYVIGGRTTSNQLNEGLLNQCQVFDTQKRTWRNIANLPVQAASSCAFSYKNKVYVTGGYVSGKNRNLCIFMYQETENKWKTLKCPYPFGLQGFPLLWSSEKTLLFFGGRLDTGDTDRVWQMTIQKESADNSIQNVVFFEAGQMSEAKSLHAVYHPKHQDFAVILGGTKDPISFYNLKTNKMDESDTIAHVFGSLRESLVESVSDQTLKTYLVLNA